MDALLKDNLGLTTRGEKLQEDLHHYKFEQFSEFSQDNEAVWILLQDTNSIDGEGMEFYEGNETHTIQIN